MSTPNAGDLVCPQCGHSNPPKSDYCWECRYDFVPDDRPKAKRRPPAAPRLIPPPDSQRPSEPRPPRPQVSVFGFLANLAVSTVIIWGSWKLLSFAYPSMNLLVFLAGWAAVLMLAYYSEGRLPDVETDITKYWSFNPFEFEDDRNRRILDWHVMLFLPKIVLRTIRGGLAVFSGGR